MRSLLAARRFRVTVVALLLAIMAVSPASARRGRLVPPGNSGAWQYSEKIPTASGSQTTGSVPPAGGASGRSGGSGGPGGSAGANGPVSSATARALAAQGPAGIAAANVARATAPSASAHHSSTHGGVGGGAQISPSAHVLSPGGSTPSAASSVFKALTGSSSSGGLGVLMPILLGVTFLTMGGLALLRNRTTD